MQYTVFFEVMATISTEVEADSADEAKALAEAKILMPGLCHECAQEVQLNDIIEITEVVES